MAKKFASSKNVRNFAPQFSAGALVQLVRMPACHAGGRWFESCTHRKWREEKSEDVLRHYSLFLFLFFSIKVIEVLDSLDNLGFLDHLDILELLAPGGQGTPCHYKIICVL